MSSVVHRQSPFAKERHDVSTTWNRRVRLHRTADWPTLPEGWTFHEVADVVVGPGDRVYVFNRGEHPMIVFEADGTFVTSWGEGVFTRPHGVTLGPDGNL